MTSTAPIDLDPLIEEEARRWTVCGYRVESRLSGQIVLVKGKRPSHVLHLLLSLITVGLWLPVWLCIGVFGGEKRRVVSVDHCGLVVSRKA